MEELALKAANVAELPGQNQQNIVPDLMVDLEGRRERDQRRRGDEQRLLGQQVLHLGRVARSGSRGQLRGFPGAN